ncbi:MAG: DUF4157 domain-containing protein [Anaerolineae bacterium]|nr:DUF4157 domain-containing protein [Anaerolineae bacterium]
MRMIPSFIGLIKTGLARSSRFARLGETARGRWSGVLSRHPLTTSTWGLARWSPAALSGRLAGWATRQPWGGGWADRVYGPRQPRSRRPGRTMRSADRTGADFRATSPLRQAEGDEAPLSWPSWFADESGTEAEETLDLSGPWLTPPADALPAEPPVERLVAASLERAYQMPGIAWTDVRVTQPSGTRHSPLGLGRVADEVAAGLLSASRASVERVVRRGPPETGRPPGASGTWWVEPGGRPVTLSTPLPPASAERLWQPTEPVRITAQRFGNLREVGASQDFPERPLVEREARVPDGETPDQGGAEGRPATVLMSGPPSPTRLWQAPPPRLTRSRLTPPAFAAEEASESGRPEAWSQRRVEAGGDAFVAAPLHPARLWRPPLERAAPVAGVVWSEPAAGGTVYRQARSGREPTGYLSSAWGMTAQVDKPAIGPAVGLGRLLRPSDGPRGAREDWSTAGLPPTPRSAALAHPWPLGEPMTSTGRVMLTGVGTAPRSRRTEGGMLSQSLPSLLTPRQPAALQHTAAPAVEAGSPAKANAMRGWTAGATAASTPSSESAARVGGMAGAVTSLAVSPAAATVRPHPDWPVLARLTSLAAPAAAPEPAAFQALRRLAPARAQAALTALASLPSLGGGEPLREEVRRPMETLTRRDLSDVRLYTSPVAEALGAEAFTSGQRVVFAPGRLNLRTPQGMALLGHELSHIGQPLAFKLTSGANPTGDDAEEQAAGQQEDVIRRAVEQGWPEGSRREVRQAARALSAMMEHGGIAQPPGPGGPAAPGAPGASPSSDGASPGGGSDGAAPVATARLSEATQAGGAAPAAPPNVEALAKQVYSILKARLRAERERHQVYDR